MAEYSFVFNSVRAEQVNQEISLFGVYMSMAMNADDGQFDGTFQLDQTGKRNEDLITSTVPNASYVVAERNGIPIGGWIITSRVYSAQSKTFQLHGMTFDIYPKRARILTDLTFDNIEQREIFKSLWSGMQSVYGRNLNVNIPSGTFPNVVRKTLSLKAIDIKYYGEVMSSIADAVDGFDWYITFTKQGNYYKKDLLIGYPNLGTSESVGSVVFDYPGNVTQYYLTESVADAGTNILVIGAGEGSSMLKSEVAHTDLLNNGMLRLDVDIARKDINSQTILNSIALNEAATRKAPMTVIKLTVKADKTPEFGSYNLGDTLKMYLEDARNPNGTTLTKRLIKWELHVPSADSVEEVDLTFEGDTD